MDAADEVRGFASAAIPTIARVKKVSGVKKVAGMDAENRESLRPKLYCDPKLLCDRDPQTRDALPSPLIASRSPLTS